MPGRDRYLDGLLGMEFVMSLLGHSRPGRDGSQRGHVGYAADS
jgi:hypothetical protein